jgi:hypothetical protein
MLLRILQKFGTISRELFSPDDARHKLGSRLRRSDESLPLAMDAVSS